MSKSDILSSKNIKQWIVGSCATLLLLSAIIAGNLVGCGNSKGVNTIADKKVDLTPTNELVLDIPRYRWFPQYYKDAIEEFEEQYPDVKVTVNRLGDKEDHTMEQYQTALTNELMAGAGPDVILTDYFTSDLYKTMDTGAFLNLSSIISGDKNFNMGDYNSSIMSSGYYKGGQYIIPLGYTVQIKVAEQSGLHKIGFDMNKVTDCTSFVREISNCLPKAQENPLFRGMFDWPILTRMLRVSGILLVDEKTNTALPDEVAIRAFCEAYQPYYDTDYDDTDYAEYTGSQYDLYSQGIMPFGYTSNNTDWIFYYTYLKTKSGNPVVIAPKSVDGGLRATVTNGVAIRSGSTNQLNAWNFIKILLSTQLQEKQPGNGRMGYPVNTAALKVLLNSFKTMGIRGISSGENGNEKVDFSLLTSEDIDHFQTTLNSVSSCTLLCEPMENLFMKCMEPYFKKERSLDSCMQDLKRQLNLYVSE